MPFSLPIGNDYGVLRFTLPMNRVIHVESIFVAPPFVGWSGPKDDMTMDELSLEELEFLMELLIEYQDTRDLTQREWANTKTLLDKLDAIYEKWD